MLTALEAMLKVCVSAERSTMVRFNLSSLYVEYFNSDKFDLDTLSSGLKCFPHHMSMTLWNPLVHKTCLHDTQSDVV